MNMVQYLILSMVVVLVSCSEPNGIDGNIQIESREGYYLAVTLDSNQRIHSRSDSLYMAFTDVYYFSDCVVNDFFIRPVLDQPNHVEVIMPFGGVLAPECPIQTGIQDVEWRLGPSDFPSEDTLIVYGQSEYLVNDLNQITGGRQGLIPLDTIELRWGDYRSQDFKIQTDSFAQIENDLSTKSLQRVLVKDSSAYFYLEISNSVCPKAYVNQECTSVYDTTWTTILSQRDRINDSTFNQIEIDTVKWIVNKKCSNSAEYCRDVEQSSFDRIVLDTLLQLKTYETWWIEKLKACSLFNILRSASGSPIANSDPGLPTLGSFRIERSLFDLDESRETCLSSEHFYGYSFTSDSLIFDQALLDSLWKFK